MLRAIRTLRPRLLGGAHRRWATQDASEKVRKAEEAAEEAVGIPTGVKVAAAMVGGGLLLAFHYMLLGQREKQDALYREKIEALQEEVHRLRSRLKEVERARFKGKPVPHE
eukprot:s325_g35.t1